MPAYGPLLRAESPTDLCLACHVQEGGVVFGSDPLVPAPELGAGNFTFLLEDNINDGPDGAVMPIPGHRAGHSVVSLEWNLAADPDHVTAPGGSFPSSQLSCVSCHDPHGNSNYRMLYGQGQIGEAGFAFVYDAPIGAGIDVGPESPSSHAAYHSGWSDWCANCHGFYHGELQGGFEHPSDRPMSGPERDSYNEYDGPDAPAGGQFATAYLPEVAIEDPNISVTSTFGVHSSSRVNCLSCHRAHATSAPASLRWDPNVLRLSEDGLVSGSYAIPDPYAHAEQRALCVKCHYEDALDHGMDEPCMSCHREHQ